MVVCDGDTPGVNGHLVCEGNDQRSRRRRRELIQREWWSTEQARVPGSGKGVSGHVHHWWHVQGRDPERVEEKLVQRDGDAGGADTAARVRPDLCHAL